MLARLLGVCGTVIRSMGVEDGEPVAGVAPRKGRDCRCPRCNRKPSGPAAPRRWCSLDFGSTVAHLEDATVRVWCPVHDVVTASVPWVELGISNARVEAINNKAKLTVRMAYGFRNMDNPIAAVMSWCSNLPVALLGRGLLPTKNGDASI